MHLFVFGLRLFCDGWVFMFACGLTGFALVWLVLVGWFWRFVVGLWLVPACDGGLQLFVTCVWLRG